jgi:flagellar hook assembly protein FlgD
MGLVSTRRPPDKSPLVQERLDAIYEKVRRSFEENLTTIDDATRRLASGELDAGPHQVQWDGRLDTGSFAPAGVYLVRIESEGMARSRRLLWLP